MEEPKVTPITSAEDKKRAKEIEKEMKQREKNIERFERQCDEYYEFFMLGGALQWAHYRSLSPVEKAAVAAARKRVRDGDSKFNMKCMMAVFDHSLAKIMQQATPPAPLPTGPDGKELLANLVTDDPQKKDEQETVSKVLDTMVHEEDPRTIAIHDPELGDPGSMAEAEK